MRLVVACVLVIALGGTARGATLWSRVGQVAWAPVRYAGDRLEDLLDVLEVNASAGRGAKLDLSYGVHFFGIGQARPWRAGNIDRRAGTWREIDEEISLFPLSLLGWPVYWAADAAGARRLAADAYHLAREATEGVRYLDVEELNGDPAYIWKDTVGGYYGPLWGISLPTGFRHTRWGDCFPIGAEFHALVGLRVRLRPLQLADFVIGFFGLDLDPALTRKAY